MRQSSSLQFAWDAAVQLEDDGGRQRRRTHDARDGKLPVIKRKVHDRLSVTALTATAAVGSEAVEHALGHVDVGRSGGCGRKRRERAKAEVARAFTVYGGRLSLDAFRDELEELLRVLVLT
jgi:hypothetical protein